MSRSVDPLFTIQIKKSSKAGSESHTRAFFEYPFNRNQTRARLHEAVDEFCDLMKIPKEGRKVEQDIDSDRRSLVQQ